MKAKRYAVVDRSRCVACGACLQECPRGAMQVWGGCFAKPDLSLCVGCGLCAKVCPADVITLAERGETA